MNHAPLHVLDRIASETRLESGDEFEEWRPHLKECSTCDRRLSDLRAENQAYYIRRPAGAVCERVRATTRRRSVAPMVWGGVGLAVASAVAVVVINPTDENAIPIAHNVTFKGQPALTIEAERPGEAGATVIRSGAVLPPGTSLNLHIDPAGRPHVSVFLMNEKGKTNRLMALFQSRAGFLPSNLTLDEAHEPERLFVVFSESPLSEDHVRRSLAVAFERAGGNILQLQNFDVDGVVRSFLVKKQPR